MNNLVWDYVPLTSAVEIYDSLRQPVNSKERAKRIEKKKESDLFPYYGATGQVGYIDDFLIDGEYVLLGEDGAPFLDALAEKAYIINGKSWVNNHAHILQSKTSNRFLCFYLNYFNYKNYVSGTTRLKLTQARMKQIPVPVPPLPEQERIVAQIEDLFSKLDKAVETLKTIKQQLAVYRQAVLKEAFEGKYTNSIPQKYVSISDIANVGTGATPLTSNSAYYGGKIAWITSSKINDEKIYFPSEYITEKAIKETNCKVYPPHTLLIAMYGEGKTRGKCAELMISAATNQALAAIELHHNTECFRNYLRWFLILNYQLIRRRASGGVQPNLNLSIIKNIDVPIFNEKDQIKIVEELENRISTCDNIEKTVDTALQQAEAMRQSILKQAFEGRL